MSADKSHSKVVADRLLSSYYKSVDEEYRRQRDSAAEDLHNALSEVITEHSPSVETLLYVLEMLRMQAMSRQARENFKPSEPVEVKKLENISDLHQVLSQNGHVQIKASDIPLVSEQ